MSAKLALSCVLVVAVLGCVAVLVFSGTFAGSSDSASYMNSGRLLARGRLSEPIRAITGIDARDYRPQVFSPVGHRPGREPGTLVTVYPLGYPLHLAAASWLVGLDRAAAWVNAAAFGAAVLLLYGIGIRLELPPVATLVAVAVFVCFPVTVLAYTRVMSDGVATAWCLAAFLSALSSRRQGWLAAAAGFAYGVAALVRPTNLVLAPALLLTMPFDRRALSRFLLGGAPVAVALAVWNYHLYGQVLATGYSGMASQFRLANLWPCVVFFAEWLSRFLSPLPFILAAGGVWMVLRGDRRMLGLLAWAGAVFGLYSFYWHSFTGGWWRLRFLLPALPAVLLAALLVADDLRQRTAARRKASRLFGALVVCSLLTSVVWPLAASSQKVVADRLWEVGQRDAANVRIVHWMEQQIEPTAVILASELSGSLWFYSKYPIVRYDELTSAEFERLRRQGVATGIPVYSLLNSVDLPRHKAMYPGVFEIAGRESGATLWRLRDARSPKWGPAPIKPIANPVRQ